MLAEISNMSSADRPLAMRMRPDLECRQLRMRGRPQWSIKDPLARRFYQVREEEFFVLRQLDNQTLREATAEDRKTLRTGVLTSSLAGGFLGVGGGEGKRSRLMVQGA